VRILVTGLTGAIGAQLAPRLVAAGHDVTGLARDPTRATVAAQHGIPVLRGDVVTGDGLAAALDGVEVAYYLVHSMEASADGFAARDRTAALVFRDAARAAGVRRVVYLGGLVPPERAASPHLASRLEVERILHDTTPESVALRASIVISAASRSFRFLVRLVERLPVVPLPAWRDFRTQPIDGRDVLAFLERAGTRPEAAGRSLDIAGPDVLTYGEMVLRIADLMHVGRPPLRLGFTASVVTSRVAAAVAGETHELIGPLMAGLEGDLLARDDHADTLLGVRLHRFDAAVERALRDWEASGEPLAAR
jgi:uncharacterized protein YbjT (DUF2867 family)